MDSGVHKILKNKNRIIKQNELLPSPNSELPWEYADEQWSSEREYAFTSSYIRDEKFLRCWSSSFCPNEVWFRVSEIHWRWSFLSRNHEKKVAVLGCEIGGEEIVAGKFKSSCVFVGVARPCSFLYAV